MTNQVRALSDPRVEHRFVIVKPDGRLACRYLFDSKEAAWTVAFYMDGPVSVHRAERATWFMKVNATTLRARSTFTIGEACE